MSNPEKKRRGRQKVAMVRIEKESRRLVSFSKRRSGLFKKANELCTLCGAKVAIVVFSPGKKTFSFGYPSVDDVVKRYMPPTLNDASNDTQSLDDPQDDSSSRFNMELNFLNNQIEGEKKQIEELVKFRKLKREELTWLDSMEELEFAHLKQLQGQAIVLESLAFQFGTKLVLEAMSINPIPVVGSTPMASGYYFPSNETVYEQNLFDGQSSKFMVPNPIKMGPNDHAPIVIIPTPTRGFEDPSLSMGSNGTVMNHANPSSFIAHSIESSGYLMAPMRSNDTRMGPVNPSSFMPHSIGGFGDLSLPIRSNGTGMKYISPASSMAYPVQGFDAISVPPFHGANNSIGGEPHFIGGLEDLSLPMGSNGTGMKHISPASSMAYPVQGFDAPSVPPFLGANNSIGGKPHSIGGLGDLSLPMGSNGTGMKHISPTSSMAYPIQGFDASSVPPFLGANNSIGGKPRSIEGLGDFSLPMGSNGTGMKHISPASSMAYPVQGFDAPSVPPSPRANNSIRGELDGPPTPFNLGMDLPMSLLGDQDQEISFTSLLMEPNPMDAMIAHLFDS